MNEVCATVPRRGGRVIKTLSNIRFIRSAATSRPDEKKPPTGETPKEPSVAYVSSGTERHPYEAYVSPEPRRWRSIEAAPDIVALIEWFWENRHRLPTEPCRFSPWQNIINPAKFYDALAIDAKAYLGGPRSRVIGEDLRSLRERFAP